MNYTKFPRMVCNDFDHISIADRNSFSSGSLAHLIYWKLIWFDAAPNFPGVKIVRFHLHPIEWTLAAAFIEHALSYYTHASPTHIERKKDRRRTWLLDDFSYLWHKLLSNSLKMATIRTNQECNCASVSPVMVVTKRANKQAFFNLNIITNVIFFLDLSKLLLVSLRCANRSRGTVESHPYVSTFLQLPQQHWSAGKSPKVFHLLQKLSVRKKKTGKTTDRH